MRRKYKIEIREKDIFDTIKAKYSIEIPYHLACFFEEHNAASPFPDCIDISGTERVVDAILSVNENDEAASFFTAVESIDRKGLIPFAIDPFGNYFCLDDNGRVVFVYQEENLLTLTSYSLDEFINQLHE